MNFRKKYETILQIDRQKCIGCGACVAVCRHKVWRLAGIDNRRYIAEVERINWCSGCGKCEKICRTSAITIQFKKII